MAMECPSCGGHLGYDIKSSKLHCPFCESSFEVDDYQVQNSGILNVSSYVCKHCGAELSSPDRPDEQIVHYCNYCGGESVLLSNVTQVEMPESIIPFKITKEKVKENYQNTLKRMYFVPKNFSNPEFLDSFKGIYIPYWRTKVNLKNQTLSLSGKEFKTSGGYDYTRYYDFNVQVDDTEIDSGVYDASSALDDTIANSIVPFNEESIQPFNDVYFAGFYADKATALIENYDEAIKENALNVIKEEMNEITDGIEVDEKDIKEKIEFERVPPKTSLFPLWFLTWRKNKRVAYSIMNGETGKLSVEVPVDYFKFFRAAFFGILIVFGLLSLLPSFIIPLKMSLYASYCLIFSSLFLRSQIKKIYLRENHIYDYGNIEFFKKNIKLKKKVGGGCFSFLVIAMIIIFGIIVGDNETPDDVFFSFQLLTFVQFLVVVSSFKYLIKIKNKMGFIMLLSVLMQLSGVLLSGADKPEDFWYLIITILCLSGMIINLVISIFYINYMVTRAVPGNFYSRKGA